MKGLVQILTVIVVLITVFSHGSSTQAEPQMIALGTLGGLISLATDINESNQVVGASAIIDEQPFPWPNSIHAFLWQDGVMEDLGTLGGEYSYALAINNLGQIVGQAFDEERDIRAFLWSEGQMQDLGTLGGYSSTATDINDSGKVVGSSVAANGETHAFLWYEGIMYDLGTLGGSFSEAYAINDRNEVVGFSTNSAGNGRPFLWRDGVMQDLGTLGGDTGIAYAINDWNVIVGHSTSVSHDEHLPTGWYQGKIYDFGIYPGNNVNITDVTNSGMMTGYYYPEDVSSVHCYRWDNGTAVELGTLGGTSCQARGINETGYVVGSSSYTADGHEHAFLWKP